MEDEEEKAGGQVSRDISRHYCNYCGICLSKKAPIPSYYYAQLESFAESYWQEKYGDLMLGHFCLESIVRQRQEINPEAVSVNMVPQNKRHLKDLILFCSLFPPGYEFIKDILVWQWIAAGFIKLEDDEVMEVLLKKLLEPRFRKYLDSNQTDVAKVEHLSLSFKEIDVAEFGFLKKHSSLRTLIIHGCRVSNENFLPNDIFSELKALKILNFSLTNIVVLPRSFDDLEELQYLDVSQTPIYFLPEDMYCFSNLQTLVLDGCSSLYGLPKCTSKLINLRHLVADLRRWQSVPIGIGKLTKLRMLRTFFVGEDDGSGIGELKDMNKLRGSLSILNLENIKTKEEAAQACLCNKQDLRSIQFRWNLRQEKKNPNEEEILECLEPPLGIQELDIDSYSGGVLPTWICNPSFSELVRIVLCGCRYWSSLPSLGELPALKLLRIIENDEVVEINSFFCRKETNQLHVAFPKLEKLYFDSMSSLEKWTGVEKGDFPSLHHLTIGHCPKFVALPCLSHLNSLFDLRISYCPELPCLPDGELPSTLEYLAISDSPKLRDWCSDEHSEYCSKVAHVPNFYIGNRKVSP